MEGVLNEDIVRPADLRIHIHSDGPIHYEGTIRPKSHQLALSEWLG